jgi:tetratricopeptide (TPR) repeat protein
VVEAAQQMLQLQRQQLLLPLHHTLHQLADQHAWPLRHLGDPAALDLQAYTTSLLQDAIEARDNGHPELSLALLDAALAAGLANPWLLDNRARALVHRNQLPEAVAIWQELSLQQDDNLRSTAHDMLERFGTQARRQTVLAEAEKLEQAGEQEQAISTLTEALLSDSQCLEIQGKLQRLLAQRNPDLLSDDDESSQELEPHRRGLLVFTEILDILEKKVDGNQEKT